eukprot:15022267-Ditylum_brightwellii.AAC.1
MRVGFLLAGITSSDVGLSNADPASETSKMRHFELAANYLQQPSMMPSRYLLCQDLGLGQSQVP